MAEDVYTSAGPAGASAISLAGGTVLEVDHLEPGIVVDLELDTDDAAGPSFLIDASASDEEPTSIGRLVVLNDLSGDPWIHPLARIAAAAEFVATVEQRPDPGLFGPALAEVVGRVGDLFDEIDDDDLEYLDPELAERMASRCDDAAEAASPFDSVFRELARLLGPKERGELALAMDLPEFEIRMAPSMARETSDRDLYRSDLYEDTWSDTEQDYVEVKRVTPTLLRITTARTNERRWVRVLRRDGLVVLAQAPLFPEDLVEVAELVVPPDVEDMDLEVQIIEIDEDAARSSRPTDLIREAVRVGRDAARSTRLGDLVISTVLWTRCSELWSQAGDEGRATLARYLADQPEHESTVQPYLADEIARELPVSL